MSEDHFTWPEPIRILDAARHTPAKPFERELRADPEARARIAKDLDLASLERLEADLDVIGWFDGLQIDGRWRASVTQICGVTLEPFASELNGDFRVRVVPPSSPHAVAEADEVEIVLDLDAEDPPDVLEGDLVDLGAYVVEHLALELDPFPRKPDAVFEPPPTADISPFAALRDWKGGGDKGSGEG